MESKGDGAVDCMQFASPDSVVHDFDLFVIHAADDADFVRGYLLPALNLPSSRVLLINELALGALVVSEIERGVSQSRFTVAVLSPACLADRWAVFGEQLASYLSVDGVRIIPLRLTDSDLPVHLGARVTLDFTEETRWEAEAARLRAVLHTVAPAATPIPCPYPGMRPFAEHEATRFFGRDKEIDDLVGRLDRGEREIYVIGPSGSGKSSLVQAGLLHALDAGSSRLERSFVVRTIRPGERPTDRLAKALEGDLATPAATLDALMARHLPAVGILVFVDQLEELFTLAAAAERHRFIATLRALRAEARCYLLLALRADFYGALMDSELWPDLAGIARIDVAPLRGTALAQAITEPAVRAGVYLDARLCDRLVADAADEPGALPHVQETLRLLWDKRRHQLLGLAEYEALGDGGRGLDVAIARRAGTTMGALTVAQQAIARRTLLRLVSFGEGRPDTRRQQAVEALRSAADDAAEFSLVPALRVAPLERGSLAFAVGARVAANLHVVRERDRGDHVRQRGQLLGRAPAISVAIRPQEQRRERRVAGIDAAVVVRVQRRQRDEAVPCGGPVGEDRAAAEQLGAAGDRGVVIEIDGDPRGGRGGPVGSDGIAGLERERAAAREDERWAAE